jgi:predicted amidohydrolase YtcJ
MLKAFMDGSLGSRTAALAEPYSDEPNNSGIPRYADQLKLNDLATARAAANFQLGFHAIGDEANTLALNAFEAAEQVAPPNPRFRIEHSQVLLPADFDRFARLNVIASMQPSHLLTDMAWATDRLGPERAKYAYAWRSFLDHHVTLAFGTDYPVESINPFRGLYSAITRQNEAGTQTFHPEQKLKLAEAIYAYTQASAYAEFRETTKGRLEPGFFADFIVLDRDLFTSTPREILNTHVLRTVLGGSTVYEAK